jgi:hypothetical protein
MQRLIDAPMDARGYADLREPTQPAPPAPEAGEVGAVDALRELSEAFHDQFFGADDGLSPRLISAANEAQRLLVTQGRPAAQRHRQATPAPAVVPVAVSERLPDLS